MSHPKIIDLQPNRSLLNSNFNGYKLSLEKIPTFIAELEPSTVARASPKTDQYSFLHAKLYGLHNHLAGETIDGTDVVYFIDKSWRVMKSCVDSYEGALEEFQSVWEIPKHKEHSPGDYHVTMKFATNDLAIIGDGIGKLYLIETGCRVSNSTWRCVFAEEVLGSDKPFEIIDVVHKKMGEMQSQELHCLLFSIVVQEDVNKHPESALHWITLTTASADGVWGQAALREMQAKGDVYYAHIEPTCQAVYIASDNSFKFTTDSERPIVKKHSEYTWTQDSESVNIQLKLPVDYNRNNVIVNNNSPGELCVKSNECTLFECKLYEQAKLASTTLTIGTGNDNLDIVLLKVSKDCVWPYLCVPQDVAIKEILESDDNKNSEAMPTAGTAFSTQQTDECDYEEDKRVVFERLSCESHEATHRALINSHKILLTVKLGDYPPTIALRHDVDACLWQPCFINDEWSLKHEGTLDAFAYVQASKQQRKFSVCAPDLSYAVVCESSRHIFIYKQQKSVTSGELRHRTTGRKVGTIAQQQVITLANDEILGIHSTVQNLFLLTENCIYVFKMQ